MNQSIILFDGVCNLCNGAVQFVIKRDKNNYFSFASLQSAIGQKLLLENDLSLNDFNSFVLIENNNAYTRSTGVLRVLKKLNALWPLLYGFIIVPPFIRNAVYNWVAKNRYKWFGKKDKCMIPTPEIKARFLN
ncbi:MAG: thiol-disulfide oxidoreductase DCC family protein [Bacteroidota bacterium]|nr:thiol-disulfide oxidoreductase DCC family protein [Bacteroidota bacterium]